MNTTTPAEPPEESAEPSRAAEQPRFPARRVSLIATLVLVVTGASVLAYLAWQSYGTDFVAERHQESLRTQIRAQWAYPTVADVLGPLSTSTPLGSAEALIRVARFGADYEVPMIEGVRDQDLARGIGHFPGTDPGQVGNLAVSGHRVTNGEPFQDLPRLRPGDKVVIETADATYTYVMDTSPNDLVLPFTQSWVLDAVPVAPEGEAPPGMATFTDTEHPRRALITLTTCSELFHPDDRLVAFGHLVTTSPK